MARLILSFLPPRLCVLWRKVFASSVVRDGIKIENELLKHWQCKPIWNVDFQFGV